MRQDLYKYFRPEAREILDQFSRGVLDLEKQEQPASTIQRLLRLAHTLKGAARVVKQADIANRAHLVEDVLSPLRDSTRKVEQDRIDALLQHVDAIGAQLDLLGEPAVPVAAGPQRQEDLPKSVRTDLGEADSVLESVAETHALMTSLRVMAQDLRPVVGLADALMAQVGNGRGRAVASPDQLQIMAEGLRRRVSAVDRNLASTLDQMDRELRQLRETSERLRLVAVGDILTALERAARDSARALSRQVAFNAVGGDIRLDAHVLETLQGALIQIIRNAVAHGIEPEDERREAGKPPAGTVTVQVARSRRDIVVSCSDDGRGIDFDAVKRAASQRGLLGSVGEGTQRENILQILLRGGVSTAKSVTEESGRGVGLDVVREAARLLGGDVTCRSTPGVGTTFEIVIPASLSSFDALIVTDAAKSVLAIPLDAIRNTRRISPADLTFAESAASILHEQTAIPFIPLGAALGSPARFGERHWTALIVGGNGGCAAIGVEGLCGVARIVVRPLPADLSMHPLIAATFLDGEGNPQLVLDPDNLVRTAFEGYLPAREVRSGQRPVLVVDDSLTTRMLEQSILESAGYEVDVAESGEQALERVRERNYGLILVDVEMPGIDGFTFIERLRSDARLRDIPAILVTSLSQSEHRKRGREVGAQGYIVKSEFDQADLLSMIKPMMAA